MFQALLDRHKRTLLLYRSIEDLRTMLGNEEEMFDAASAYLIHGTETPNVDVHRRDEDINAGERMVRRAVLQHLALNPKQDLPGSLVLVSIVIYVERIGDYTKDLWDLRGDLTGSLRPEWVEALGGLRDQIMPMFAWCAAAVCEDDVESGNSAMDAKRRVEELSDSLLDVLLNDETATVAPAIICSLATHYMRRISAHLSNIASSVVAPLDQIGFDEQGGPTE